MEREQLHVQLCKQTKVTVPKKKLLINNKQKMS